MIRFENVGLRYGLGSEVLRDLNFNIDWHSFQFLTGPSGAGKTSLLRLMLLSLRPTRGLISMFDQDTATLSKDDRANLRRRIGIVFQDFRLLDHMTTYENVALPLRVLGKDESTIEQKSSNCCNGWDSASVWKPCRPFFQAAKSSALPLHAPSSRGRSFCSPTSRPAMWILIWASGCSVYSSNSTSPALRS